MMDADSYWDEKAFEARMHELYPRLETTGIFGAFNAVSVEERQWAAAKMDTYIDVSHRIVFDQPVDMGKHGVFTEALVHKRALADFCAANGGLYPSLGEAVSVLVESPRLNRDRHLPITITLRPAIGGTQSVAARRHS